MKLNFFNSGKTTAQILSVFDDLVDELNVRIDNDMISEECTQASKAIARIQQITSKE